jgi:hypothetical protein
MSDIVIIIIISSIIWYSLLPAKKRRRRRSDSDIGSDSDATALPRSSPTTSRGGDDLPDFDLDEDDPDAKAVKSSSMSSAAASSSSSSAPLLGEGEISSAMMGSSDAPTKSIRELLSDRSLESKLKFDDVTNDDGDAEPLPDLVELQRQKKQQQQFSSSSLQSTANVMSVDDGEGMGSRKKSRQAQRQAAAAARQQEEEENSFTNPLAKIPFLLNEKGEVAGTKILEAGAWLGIFLLVAWELYINSPFFDRAAPITPVVY